MEVQIEHRSRLENEINMKKKCPDQVQAPTEDRKNQP
jgi:hypothetical protein